MKKLISLIILILVNQVCAEEKTVCHALCEEGKRTCRTDAMNQTGFDQVRQQEMPKPSSDLLSRQDEQRMKNEMLNKYKSDQYGKCQSALIACKNQCTQSQD